MLTSVLESDLDASHYMLLACWPGVQVRHCLCLGGEGRREEQQAQTSYLTPISDLLQCKSQGPVLGQFSWQLLPVLWNPPEDTEFVVYLFRGHECAI